MRSIHLWKTSCKKSSTLFTEKNYNVYYRKMFVFNELVDCMIEKHTCKKYEKKEQRISFFFFYWHWNR